MLAGTSRKRRRSTMSSSDEEWPPQPGPSTSNPRAESSADHGMKILAGLNYLKRDRILCDVTLIAEGVDSCKLASIEHRPHFEVLPKS